MRRSTGAWRWLMVPTIQSKSAYQYTLYDPAICDDPRNDDDPRCAAPDVYERQVERRRTRRQREAPRYAHTFSHLLLKAVDKRT